MKDVVDYIEKMKGKVVSDKQIQKLCSKIANLSENVKSLLSTNERLTSELMVVKNVNNILQNRIVNLVNQIFKNENYGRWNKVGISGVSNEIPNQDLEENIIKFFKDSDINISHMDIGGSHRLPLGRNTTNTTKQVIVKIVNQKYSEAMLQWKKDNTKYKVFVNHSLCLSYCYLWGKCKDRQRKDRISHVFSL